MSGESARDTKDARSAAARRASAGASRVARAWQVLPHERRLAAGAAVGLFFTLFLPWYQETIIVPGRGANLQAASATLTGWGAFSFVEAAVLLVAAGVLTLLFQRAEGRAFHLPGGDGTVITAAGVWTCLLVIWRIFDKQGTTNNGQLATTSGIEWGIFIALTVAVLLTYAGTRIRAAHQPEPPLPGEKPAPTPSGPPPRPRSPSTPTATPKPRSEPAAPAKPLSEPAAPAKSSSGAPAPALPPAEASSEPPGNSESPAEPAPRRRRPASLSAPAGASPPPYPRAAARSASEEGSEHPTLPQPDRHDKPTLPQRAPGSLWRAPSPPDERDTEPKAPPDEHLTIPLEPRDDS
jgi:hypothetical protein